MGIGIAFFAHGASPSDLALVGALRGGVDGRVPLVAEEVYRHLDREALAWQRRP